jgi:hypothetical protein
LKNERKKRSRQLFAATLSLMPTDWVHRKTAAPRSHATATGKRGGGRTADAKNDAKNERFFHDETRSNTRSA